MTEASAWIFVVMGVSGSGKTTIGTLLAERVGAELVDADDYHPQANKDKMHRGEPLTDEDRWPWLAALNRLLREHAAQGTGCVLACSALRAVYREKLQEGLPAGALHLVLLEGSKEMIASRMAHRHHEFMSNTLLESQFSTLEAPANAIRVCNDATPDEVVERILKAAGVTGMAHAAGE